MGHIPVPQKAHNQCLPQNFVGQRTVAFFTGHTGMYMCTKRLNACKMISPCKEMKAHFYVFWFAKVYKLWSQKTCCWDATNTDELLWAEHGKWCYINDCACIPSKNWFLGQASLHPRTHLRSTSWQTRTLTNVEATPVWCLADHMITWCSHLFTSTDQNRGCYIGSWGWPF